MTQMQWITYGVPLLSVVFAAVTLFGLRRQARRFDDRFGAPRHPHPGE